MSKEATHYPIAQRCWGMDQGMPSPVRCCDTRNGSGPWAPPGVRPTCDGSCAEYFDLMQLTPAQRTARREAEQARRAQQAEQRQAEQERRQRYLLDVAMHSLERRAALRGRPVGDVRASMLRGILAGAPSHVLAWVCDALDGVPVEDERG